MSIALSAYALAAARLADLSAPETQSFLACTLLAMAFATFLQSWGGRTGAGALMVHIPDPVMLPFAALVLRETGLPGMFMLGMAAGIPAVLVSGLIPRLRVLFPPAVLGVVVCMAGISLVQGALSHGLGLNANFVIDPASLLISSVTLGTTVAVSVWGPRNIKLFGLIAGLAAGVAVAAFTGQLHGIERLGTGDFIALPSVPLPTFSAEPGLIAVIVMVALLAQLDTSASVVILDKMDDAGWHRPDMKMIGRGILANGLGNLAAGVLGGMPNGASSANIGLSYATHSTSRWVGIAAAMIVAVVACLPQVTLALTLIPTPVIGAIEVYAAAFLIVSGLELATSRALDSRSMFMIGISLVIGIGILIMPQIAASAPPTARHLAGSGFAMAGLSAILLNLLFRLGTSMTERRSLDAERETGREIVDFIEAQGGKWAARREVVSRAALAAMEAAELVTIYGQGRRPTAIRAHFDERNFDIEILHSGPPIAFRGAETPDITHLLDADDSVTQQAMANISSVLVQRLADRVRTGTRDGQASIALHFEH